jgi:MFS family permease
MTSGRGLARSSFVVGVPTHTSRSRLTRRYRIYLGGQSLANTGTWMQSIAQDWLIFDLTHSSVAVGVTMALQFLPMLVLGLHTGAVADRLPKRRILLTTQTLNAAATAALAAVTIAGAARPADVYAFALLSGLIFAFDAPARQAFVAEVASDGRLRAAIALNAAVFQATRLIGPAVASSWRRRPRSGCSRWPRRSRRTWLCSSRCWPAWAWSTSRSRPWRTRPFSSPSTRICAAG